MMGKYDLVIVLGKALREFLFGTISYKEQKNNESSDYSGRFG